MSPTATSRNMNAASRHFVHRPVQCPPCTSPTVVVLASTASAVGLRVAFLFVSLTMSLPLDVVLAEPVSKGANGEEPVFRFHSGAREIICPRKTKRGCELGRPAVSPMIGDLAKTKRVFFGVSYPLWIGQPFWVDLGNGRHVEGTLRDATLVPSPSADPTDESVTGELELQEPLSQEEAPYGRRVLVAGKRPKQTPLSGVLSLRRETSTDSKQLPVFVKQAHEEFAKRNGPPPDNFPGMVTQPPPRKPERISLTRLQLTAEWRIAHWLLAWASGGRQQAFSYCLEFEVTYLREKLYAMRTLVDHAVSDGACDYARDYSALFDVDGNGNPEAFYRLGGYYSWSDELEEFDAGKWNHMVSFSSGGD